MDPNKSMDRKNSEKQYRLENSFKVNGTKKQKKKTFCFKNLFIRKPVIGNT